MKSSQNEQFGLEVHIGRPKLQLVSRGRVEIREMIAQWGLESTRMPTRLTGQTHGITLAFRNMIKHNIQDWVGG